MWPHQLNAGRDLLSPRGAIPQLGERHMRKGALCRDSAQHASPAPLHGSRPISFAHSVRFTIVTCRASKHIELKVTLMNLGPQLLTQLQVRFVCVCAFGLWVVPRYTPFCTPLNTLKVARPDCALLLPLHPITHFNCVTQTN